MTIKERIDVKEIATQALEQARGDAYKAAHILEQHAQRDVNLANELLMPLLHQACYDAIRQVCIQDRRYVARQADSTLAKQAKEGAQRIQAHATRLMTFLLPLGQKRLQDATKQDIEANAAFYAKQASTMSQRSRWLELIARAMTGKKKVKTLMTEDQLLTLWQEAAA